MRTRNMVLAVLMAGQIALPAAPLAAQERGGDEPVMWRRWVFGAVGLVIGGLPMLLADGQAKTAWCEGATCSALTTGLVAGGVGYLIGRERDEAVRERWELGPTLEREAETIRLSLPASRLVAHPVGGVLVIGEWGLSIVDEGLSAARRGGRIRGIRDITAMPAWNSVIAATAAGIYSFPLGDGSEPPDQWNKRAESAGIAGIGRRLYPDPTTALALLPPSGLFAGTTHDVRRLLLRNGSSGPEAVEAARALASDTVDEVAYAAVNGSVWTLEGRHMRGRAATSLEELGAIELPSIGGDLVINGTVAAIAAGTEGVYLVDIADARDPRLIERVAPDALDFALDVALRDGRLYIAGGSQGLMVVDVSGPGDSTVLGVVREIGSVDEVAAGTGGVLVLDRGTHEVRRVRLTRPGPRAAQ